MMPACAHKPIKFCALAWQWCHQCGALRFGPNAKWIAPGTPRSARMAARVHRGRLKTGRTRRRIINRLVELLDIMRPFRCVQARCDEIATWKSSWGQCCPAHRREIGMSWPWIEWTRIRRKVPPDVQRAFEEFRTIA